MVKFTKVGIPATATQMLKTFIVWIGSNFFAFAHFNFKTILVCLYKNIFENSSDDVYLFLVKDFCSSKDSLGIEQNVVFCKCKVFSSHIKILPLVNE